jgi:uncharacterized protein
MKTTKYLLITLLLFHFSIFSFQLKSQTYTIKEVPYDNLNDKYDFVSNPDGIISQSAENEINRMIVAVEDSATAEIAVVLLKSIGNADIDDFGTALFTQWKIGKRGKDNGLLFLLVEDRRQMIFRTGYGLEGALPDVILSRIIRDDIAPLMAQGDADQAIIAGINKIYYYLLNPEIVQEIRIQDAEEQRNGLAFFRSIPKIYLILSFVIFLYYFFFLFFRIKNGENQSRQIQSSEYKEILRDSLHRVVSNLDAVFRPDLLH